VVHPADGLSPLCDRHHIALRAEREDDNGVRFDDVVVLGLCAAGKTNVVALDVKSRTLKDDLVTHLSPPERRVAVV
jgi:hypothetical protein